MPQFYRFALTMEHVLDNPAWNALASGNEKLANGTDHVKYFSPEVSIFTGTKETSAANFQKLYELAPHLGPIGFISSVEMEIPAKWKLLVLVNTHQMIHENTTGLPAVEADIIALTEENIPEMIALTKLTNPGPFTERTIDFGHYYGIFDNGKLAAMAGQRMNPSPYAEISAVCTHPDHLGKGYAKQLLLFHLHRIKTEGNIPILHVRLDNERAINVYKAMGFTVRKNILFYILQKD